jgi:hypothetical protein
MMSIITKRSWKIRFSFIFVFIPVFLFLSACSLRHTSPLPLNESVVHLLEIMGYHDCNYLFLKYIVLRYVHFLKAFLSQR